MVCHALGHRWNRPVSVNQCWGLVNEKGSSRQELACFAMFL